MVKHIAAWVAIVILLPALLIPLAVVGLAVLGPWIIAARWAFGL